MEHEERMDEFEESLARAMRRMEAPEGFAAKVLVRAEAEGRAPSRRGLLLAMPARRRAWLSGALAAGVLGGMVWAGEAHIRREREAQGQFEAGVRITNQALDHTRRQLERAGVVLGE